MNQNLSTIFMHISSLYINIYILFKNLFVIMNSKSIFETQYFGSVNESTNLELQNQFH